MTDITFNPASLASTKHSRRAFLTGLGVIAAGSAFFAAQQRQLLAPNATEGDLLAILQRATFARYIDDTFTLVLDGVRAVLTLTAVEDLTTPITFATEAQNRAYQHISFSITFQGSAQQAFAQGYYIVEHRHIGTFPLFVVPTPSTEGAMRYEATFNRLPV